MVGYSETVETSPGIFEEVLTERKYYGDVNKLYKRWDKGEQLNDNITINNSISIIADAYAYQNFFAIRYIKWMGTAWKVNSVTVERPRLILDIGGVYNGI